MTSDVEDCFHVFIGFVYCFWELFISVAHFLIGLSFLGGIYYFELFEYSRYESSVWAAAGKHFSILEVVSSLFVVFFTIQTVLFICYDSIYWFLMAFPVQFEFCSEGLGLYLWLTYFVFLEVSFFCFNI